MSKWHIFTKQLVKSRSKFKLRLHEQSDDKCHVTFPWYTVQVLCNIQLHCEWNKLGHFYFYCNSVKCWPIL